MRNSFLAPLDDGAFIVGGRAFNIWAERYSAATWLGDFGSYTFKDIANSASA